MKIRPRIKIRKEIEDLDRQLKCLELESELFKKKKQIYDIRKSMRLFKLPTTTKIIMVYIFINCTAIEIYSMVAMWTMNDLSALYSLITAVVTESLSFAVYAVKAYNETKQEELIRLERDKMCQQQVNNEEDNGEGGEQL